MGGKEVGSGGNRQTAQLAAMLLLEPKQRGCYAQPELASLLAV